MNPMSIMASAEKLSVPELQRSIQSGVIPAFIGVPLLQEKVKRAKQMRMGMAAQQPKRPSVAEQVGQEARQASVEDMMRERARMMQDEMGQTGGISDFLPKPAEEAYAKGGPIAFDEGGLIEKRLKFIREHGLAGTVGNAYNQAYGWSSDLARSVGDPRTYKNIYSGLSDEYRDLDEATKKILWGVPDEPQGTKPTINPKDLVTQARAKPFGESNLPILEGYGNNLMPVAIDRRAPATQPTTENILNKNALNKQTPDVDQVKLMQDRIAARKAPPVIDGNAPADTRTTYAQAAQQAQPQQQEEKDQSLSDYMKQYREVTGENKGINVLQNRLSEREARLAKEEDRAPWLALMQAGLATMAGTSPFAMSNIGQGGVAGLQAYTRSMNKLEDAKDKSFDIQAKLEDAHRAEELAAAKYGLESVQADKKAKQVAQLEREKMAAQKAMNDADNAARLQVEQMQVGASKYAVDARNAAYGGTGAGKKEVTQYQYGQLVDKASDNVDKMIKDQMLSLTMSPEELSEYRQRMINTELQRMVNSTGGGNIAPAPQQTSVLPGYNLLSSK
jgi:hypothetical protein